jgi:hypothetical protein
VGGLAEPLGDFVGEVERTWEARNRVYARRSREELTAMDHALAWPARYLRLHVPLMDNSRSFSD